MKKIEHYSMDYNECRALVRWHFELDGEIMKKICEHPYAKEDNRLYFSIMKFLHQASFQLILHVFEEDVIEEEKMLDKKLNIQ